MVTIASSLTGQALFTLDVDDGVATLRPEAVRVALVSLSEAGLSNHIVGAGCSDLAKTEEK